MSIVSYPGQPYPLGATWDGEGVNFALYAENATSVELCLFDAPKDAAERDCVKLADRNNHVWHIYLPGIKPGQLYGYRIDGPFEPNDGHRFNRNKVLIAPYAKAIAGTVSWHDSLFGYEMGHPDLDLSFNAADSAPFIPKSVVIDGIGRA